MKVKFLVCFAIILISAGIIFISCTEEITGNLTQNKPPETSVFVQADSLNLTLSLQTIYWDGRDEDGFVIGFYYTWEENPQPGDWIWTTKRSETFPLQISGTDTTYTFRIKAVDNDSIEDPTPAEQVFPIKNSHPEISWTSLSQIPDTTFTIAAFSWNASDLDGDTTIALFEYSLDDTLNWNTIEGFRRRLILNADSGLTVGDHSFFIRAVDVAGAKSPIIKMPENPNANWHVQAPRGRYLLIDDFEDESSSNNFPDAFYRSLLDTLLPQFGDEYSYWNIEEQFPTSVIQFTETLKEFERIIWYADFIQQSDPRFIGAQIAIPEFRSGGGKLIYTVKFNQGFGAQGDPLGFTPVDSLGDDFRIFNNSLYYSDPDFQNQFPTLPILPELRSSNQFALFGLLALIPKATSVPMYYYDDANLQDDPLFVLIGQNDNSGQYDFVFAGTPLNQLNGNANVGELFRIILDQIFDENL
jgi:hypothetical protein